MNYRETLEYLYSRLPAFTRIGKAAYKADLDNIIQLCAALGNPEKSFRSIHIAGTNGKGSSSHYLASVFQEAGYKTGLFTSPHLKDFRERIRINGKMIPTRRVTRFVEKNRLLFETVKSSFFEMNVALAFDYFRNEQVDIAIIETGLGGRLDSTNVIVPELSLITNISFDHVDLLGNSIEQIASEKAGIIKPNVAVVVSEFQKETEASFRIKSLEKNAALYFAQEHVSITDIQRKKKYLNLNANIDLSGKQYRIKSPLTGNYQTKNLKGVLLAIELLKQKGWKLNTQQIERGIQNTISNTKLRGRWEQLGEKPDIYCDTGHNEAGVKEVIELIALQPFNELHIVWGMVSDKDIDKVLSLLPKQAHYYFCRARLPRAMPADELQQKALAMNLKGKTYTSVRRALAAAKKVATKQDLIFVGGSTFVVAEVI